MPINTFLDSDLFGSLTDQERASVEKYSSKSPSDLPKFFNAGIQSLGEEPSQSISREFEAFLILQALRSPDKLSAALQWFTEAAELQIKRSDRDELLAEAFDYERRDALKLLRELQLNTAKFSQFRSSFEVVEVGEDSPSSEYSPTRFLSVPELNLIMRDSQIAMGEIASKQSRAEHLVVEDAVLDRERLTRERLQESTGGIADDKIAEELLSWRSVIAKIQARVSGVANG